MVLNTLTLSEPMPSVGSGKRQGKGRGRGQPHGRGQLQGRGQPQGRRRDRQVSEIM